MRTADAPQHSAFPPAGTDFVATQDYIFAEMNLISTSDRWKDHHHPLLNLSDSRPILKVNPTVPSALLKSLQRVDSSRRMKVTHEFRNEENQMPTKLSNEVMLAAIDGFESQKKRIDDKIAGLRAILDGNGSAPVATTDTPARKRRKISAAARRRMKAAQQRRWAAVRGKAKEPAVPKTKRAKTKRRLSEAGRQAIIAAAKRRRAAQKRAHAGSSRASGPKRAA